MLYADGAANHPITVEPTYQSMKVGLFGSPAALAGRCGRFTAFRPGLSDARQWRDQRVGAARVRIVRRRSLFRRAHLPRWACRVRASSWARMTPSAQTTRVEIGLCQLHRAYRFLAETGRRTRATRKTICRCRSISAAPCSTTSRPWSPIRAIWCAAPMGRPTQAPRHVLQQYEQGQTDPHRRRRISPRRFRRGSQ
jgi:hypothetical protein